MQKRKKSNDYKPGGAGVGVSKGIYWTLGRLCAWALVTPRRERIRRESYPLFQRRKCTARLVNICASLYVPPMHRRRCWTYVLTGRIKEWRYEGFNLGQSNWCLQEYQLGTAVFSAAVAIVVARDSPGGDRWGLLITCFPREKVEKLLNAIRNATLSWPWNRVWSDQLGESRLRAVFFIACCLDWLEEMRL